MNLDVFEEMLIVETTYPKAILLGGTTGARIYVLVNEGDGNYYLYYYVH